MSALTQRAINILASGNHTPVTEQISPCGGRLIDLQVDAAAVPEQHAYASHLPSIQLSERAVCDLELLATGAFSPLDRFMGRADHESVLGAMRLTTGHAFLIPVTLPVEAGTPVSLDQDVALRDPRNELLAIMTIEEIFEWDLARVATGIDDPYEPPRQAEITWETINQLPEENARLILEYLLGHGFIRTTTRELSIGPGSDPGTQS